jgi:putative tryptophan/tyrosine transport system substrate-binding protein
LFYSSQGILRWKDRMTQSIKRLEFIALLGGAAAAWPLAAMAQQPAMPVIGVLYGGSELNPEAEAGLRKGLSEMGFVEGRNVTIEFRFANNQFNRLPELAAELVRRRVDVIVVPNSTPAAIAAKAATTTIPIVFSGGTVPQRAGRKPRGAGV